MPGSRYMRRACGGSAGDDGVFDLLAAERPAERRVQRHDAPSTRTEGGAPATSSRSLADRSTTCSSHARSRASCASSPPADAGAAGASAFSSVTSASRSSGRVSHGPCRELRPIQAFSSGSFRKRESGTTWRKTVSSVP